MILPSPNANPTNVTANASSVILLAANPQRRGATIYNNSDKVLHLSFNTPATTDNSAADLAAETAGLVGGYYEVPYNYTGPVYGIWESGPTGKANINEFV